MENTEKKTWEIPHIIDLDLVDTAGGGMLADDGGGEGTLLNAS